MDKLAQRLVETALWLVVDPNGTVIATRADGATLRARLAPGLDEIRAPARRTAGPATAMLHPADGTPQRVVVIAEPSGDSAVAFPVDQVDLLVGAATENLVNALAHDVRNIAFTIGLQAELGQRRSADMPQVGGHFEAILKQLTALRRYLDQLLLYGRPTRLDLEDLDAAAFLRDVVSRFKFAWEHPEPLALGLDVTGELGRVSWDPAALGKALEALLDNAARSAEPSPAMTMAARRTAAGLELAVRDEGDGIPRDLLPRLAVPMAVRRAGGAGLGLAIARKIVRAHGGSLELDSSRHGTTVTITLPEEAPAG